jgi:hypothetical protein
MSNKDVVIDYADSYMAANDALKSVYNKMLAQDYDGALESALQTIVEVKMLLAAIRHIKDVQSGETNA